jgi:ATP sulfurylase
MFEKSIFKIIDYLISNKDITKIIKITKLKDGTHWSLKDFDIKKMRSLRETMDENNLEQKLNELTDENIFD